MEHEKYKRYTNEMCNASADKHEDPFEWRFHDWLAFISAKRKGWLLNILKRKGWSSEKVFEKLLLYSKDRLNEGVVEQDAKLYSTRGSWQKQSPSIYHYAWRHNLLEKYTSHMQQTKKWKNRKLKRKLEKQHI